MKLTDLEQKLYVLGVMFTAGVLLYQITELEEGFGLVEFVAFMFAAAFWPVAWGVQVGIWIGG